MHLIIYTPKITPRVEYIFSSLLNAIGVQKFQLTQNIDFYNRSESLKISYSSDYVGENILWIESVNLLFEKEIKEQKIDIFEWNGVKAFFKTVNGDLPFDIFAASFYLISRYEEYLPHKRDNYGRYAHENSAAFKHDFLKLPLVNIWLKQFAELLLKKFPFLHLTPQAFHFLPTYDIDIAWSYLQKGWLRNAGGLIKSMMDGNRARVSERVQVLFGNQKDPFDSYEWLDELHKKYELQPIYFFLLAHRNKDYDKNILPDKKPLQKLIQQISSKYTAGIHPSWQSGDKQELLKEELEILHRITGRKADKSRQHYIRMVLPETYRRLISAGITEDYSMGYGSINGFRASYCLPYKWYDLEKEEMSSLTIYPFCYMEANSYYEQQYTTEEALSEIEHYYKIAKEVNGLLITVWHNHFLGTDNMFKDWREVYETIIEKIITT